jgi:NAD+ kinase
MERIGIITNPQADKLTLVLTELVQWLAERQIQVVVDEVTASLGIRAESVAEGRLPAVVELLIVLGGDGTLLRVARLPGIHQVPILGVNLGGLGFLTEITREDLFPALEKVLAHEFLADTRMMIHTQIKRKGQVVNSHINLNDIVINKGVMARMIRLDTHINGQYVNTFQADGLIISSPTGSTAYSMSAGGPILYPSTKALIITPICPHTLTNRPIVIPDDFQIEINLKSENEDVYLTCDGQQCFALQYEDVVQVTKSEYTIKLIQPQQKNYYQVLRSKLNWGVR